MALSLFSFPFFSLVTVSVRMVLRQQTPITATLLAESTPSLNSQVSYMYHQASSVAKLALNLARRELAMHQKRCLAEAASPCDAEALSAQTATCLSSGITDTQCDMIGHVQGPFRAFSPKFGNNLKIVLGNSTQWGPNMGPKIEHNFYSLKLFGHRWDISKISGYPGQKA